MRINYNVSAMLSNNALSNNDNLLSKSLEKLSSGLKINHAKDNPSGLAMAKRMNAQIEGLSIANTNASDGISIIETADGAMSEISDMLQRMNELAVKSANGTMTDEDRETIQEEIDQLKEEITRISDTTEFNSQKLLNGEYTAKGYTTDNNIKVNSYSSEVTATQYTIDSLTLTSETDENGETTYKVGDIQLGDGFDDLGDVKAELKDDLLTLKNSDGFELTLDVSGMIDNNELSASGVEVDVLGIGAMRLQIGSNEGQVLEVEIPAVTLQNMTIEDIDVTTADGANDAIERIKEAQAYTSSVRGKLGAYQNRLESTTDSLDVTSENMTSAYSRIMDVDMAEEMTNYSTYQVLTQAGTSMLAQANERPSQVLQLLQ